MINGTTNYMDQYNEKNLVAGGAAGAFTIEEVDEGDALGGLNTQKNAFQFGAKVAGEGPFVVQSALLPNYFNQAPQNFQSQGIYVGGGDQNNYLKLALNANGGTGGFEVVYEVDGVVEKQEQFNLPGGIPNVAVRLFILLDPGTNRAFMKYCITNGDTVALGSPVPLKGKIVKALTDQNESLAIGIIATSRGANKFNATWDYMEAYQTTLTSINQWKDGTLTEKIHLFPNPGKDKVRILVETEEPKTYTLRIYNSMGVMIQQTEMSWSNFNENELAIANLIPGVYQLQFVDEKSSRTASVKIVKE
jgi:hypothetical protein